MNQLDSFSSTIEPEGSSRRQGDDEASAMSLLGGVAGGGQSSRGNDFDMDEPYTEAGHRGLSKGTLAVILIALVALGVLYGMRVMQGDLGAAGDAQVEARMEQILAKLNNPDALDANDPLRPQNIDALFRDTDSIVASLDTDLTGRQVPAAFVKKNPFILPFANEPTVEAAPIDDTEQQRQALLGRLRNELNSLNLQSVMSSGPNPVAIVNGEMYRPGETLGSFQIVSISVSNQTVRLEAADETFTLSMGQ